MTTSLAVGLPASQSFEITCKARGSRLSTRPTNHSKKPALPTFPRSPASLSPLVLHLVVVVVAVVVVSLVNHTQHPLVTKRTTQMSNNRAIVIGGGLAGLSAAHTLLERGASVLLLDKQGCVVNPHPLSLAPLQRSHDHVQVYGRQLDQGH